MGITQLTHLKCIFHVCRHPLGPHHEALVVEIAKARLLQLIHLCVRVCVYVSLSLSVCVCVCVCVCV